MRSDVRALAALVFLYTVLLVVGVVIVSADTAPVPTQTALANVGALQLLATTAADTHYPPSWRQRLLALLGAPIRVENLRFLQAWGTAEGGTAKWNPLNATYVLSYGESWSYNSSAVQNYWRPTGGIAANALTMIQTNYACLVGSFQAAVLTAEQIVAKCPTAIRAWGTSPATISAILAQR